MFTLLTPSLLNGFTWVDRIHILIFGPKGERTSCGAWSEERTEGVPVEKVGSASRDDDTQTDPNGYYKILIL